MSAAPPSAPAAAIVLEDVSYTYPGAERPVLRGVSLEIPQGQCVVVTGASGCGKTTLTRLINGLVPHVYAGEVAGCVMVEGTEVAAWTPDELGVRVGSVFQNPRSQFVNLDVASEIAFGCENLGLPRDEIVARVHEAARALGIADLLDRGIEELSGGQKQAVAIASAFAMEPTVFVLDEPTASLDVPSMKRLAEVVAALKAAGKTVVVSEHRLWWLADVADWVVLMEDGAVAGDWTAADFAALPAARRAAAGVRAWTVAEMEGEGRPAAAVPAGAVPADAPAPEAPRLQAEGLTVAFRRRPPVLDGLDLSLEPGRVLGIVGRNGAGKTTLLRCLAGLTRERAGAVAVDGAPVAARRRPGLVHLVMQEPGYQLFADSARAELHRESDEVADAMLAAFGLAPAPSAIPWPSPVASASAWPWLPASPRAPGCSCSTSPRAAWTAPTWSALPRFCAGPPPTASPWPSSPTTTSSSARSAMRRPRWKAAASRPATPSTTPGSLACAPASASESPSNSEPFSSLNLTVTHPLRKGLNLWQRQRQRRRARHPWQPRGASRRRTSCFWRCSAWSLSSS